jgi:hypothetical protein
MSFALGGILTRQRIGGVILTKALAFSRPLGVPVARFLNIHGQLARLQSDNAVAAAHEEQAFAGVTGQRVGCRIVVNGAGV